MKRRLDELNLLDDFLFGSVVTSPQYGKRFCQIVLGIIFGRPFEELKVVPQKSYYGADTDKHGVRLDVYLEEAEGTLQTSIYDMEVESEFKKKQLEGLAKRVRFYRALIDARSLKAGADYAQLKQVTVLMILPFDPFGENHMVYTIRNKCEELPDMPYDDGAQTIFLYTKGEKGEPKEQLRQLLQYMEHSVVENAVTPVLKELHEMVEHVKRDGEVGVKYMKIFEREQMIREEGMECGRENGILYGLRNLMQTLDCTVDQAMNALLIPEEEREKYRAML